ncbi:hypothetical protein HSBAA_24930 [Vreelandella sulfidaeris]|uniref:Arginine biosynthesis bifunctional protein ArgJ n=1 Tax=Vreelandella sulfidaeris TaxID=115553 RepID=A0A455U6M9_9GAMM|nr:hypothetical protein HSBAA_24930 [Halomonas sulfidaeris]
MVVIELPDTATVSGVFTRNAFCAAPVIVAKQHLEQCRAENRSPRFWLINTGNANAGTGKAGLRDARASCAELAKQAGVSVEDVLPFSTGVIGEPLPMDRLLAGLAPALGNLASDAVAWQEAGQGILTTDTRAKGATVTLEIGDQSVTISGIAKGRA